MFWLATFSLPLVELTAQPPNQTVAQQNTCGRGYRDNMLISLCVQVLPQQCCMHSDCTECDWWFPCVVPVYLLSLSCSALFRWQHAVPFANFSSPAIKCESPTFAPCRSRMCQGCAVASLLTAPYAWHIALGFLREGSSLTALELYSPFDALLELLVCLAGTQGRLFPAQTAFTTLQLLLRADS